MQKKQQTHKKWIPLFAFLFLTATLTIGCGINDSVITDQTFEFKFDSANHGWKGDFVDLPVNAGDIYEMAYEPFKPLPTELGTGSAPFLKSQNRSDDVFMYLKKEITGLSPNTNYVVYFEVTLGTNVPANSVGIGGSPSESVYVKAGGSTIEPKGIIDSSGTEAFYRLNVDKGNQSTSGANAVVIGNVAKAPGDSSDLFQEKKLTNEKKLVAVRSDANGNAWVFVGTDSAFEGLTQLYYKKVLVRFE